MSTSHSLRPDPRIAAGRADAASPAPRYGAVAVGLHWVVALAVFAQLALGWWMIDLPKTPPGLRAGWFNMHKSIGMSIGMLVMLRLAWRLTHPAPPLPATVPRWQQTAASVNHVVLYLCLFLLPTTGYLGSSFSGYPIRYFGTVIPSIGGAWPAGKAAMSGIHEALVWLLMASIAAHVAAALWHLVARRDGVFERMCWRPTRVRRPLARDSCPLSNKELQ